MLIFPRRWQTTTLEKTFSIFRTTIVLELMILLVLGVLVNQVNPSSKAFFMTSLCKNLVVELLSVLKLGWRQVQVKGESLV